MVSLLSNDVDWVTKIIILIKNQINSFRSHTPTKTLLKLFSWHSLQLILHDLTPQMMTMELGFDYLELNNHIDSDQRRKGHVLPLFCPKLVHRMSVVKIMRLIFFLLLEMRFCLFRMAILTEYHLINIHSPPIIFIGKCRLDLMRALRFI